MSSASSAPSAAPTSVRATATPAGTSASEPDLASLLPDTWQGKPTEKHALDGRSYIDPNNPGPAGQAMLDVFGGLAKTLDDFSYAYAGPIGTFLFHAFRLRGVDAAIWIEPFLRAGTAGVAGVTLSSLTIAGRMVKKISVPGDPTSQYAYPRGDVVFAVVAGSDAEAGQLLAVMPN